MTPSSTPTVHATSSVQNAIEPSMRDTIRELLENEPGLSQGRIAKEIGQGVSSATLSQWLNANYQGDNAKIEARVAAWLDTYMERRSRSGLPEAPQWVDTPTTAKIESGLRYAQLAQDVVIIFGAAGVSKTKTCEHYVTQAPGVVMATMTPALEGVMGCLQAIAEAAGVRDVPHSVPALHRAIILRLRGTSGLLLIDEAQHLGIKALDEVRSIQDQCAIGLALVGNEFVFSRLTDPRRAAYLDRLSSRIGKVVRLVKPTSQDIELLIDAWKVNDQECRGFIRDLAKRTGHLRVLTKTLRLAASFAAAQQKPLCCEHIKAAHRDLGAFE